MDELQQQYAAAAGQHEAVSGPRFRIRFPSLNRRVLTITGGITLAALVIAGGTYAYLAFNSPERALTAAFSKLATVRTMQYEGQVTVQLKEGLTDGGSGTSPKSSSSPSPSLSWVPSAHAAGVADQGSPMDLVLSARGAVDISDKEKPKTAQTFKLTGQYAQVPVGSVAIETRTIGQTGYVRLAEYPVQYDLFGLSSLKDQWIKFDATDVEQQVSGEQKPKEQSVTQFSPDQSKQLGQAAKKAKLFKLKQLKDDPIDGQPAMHFQYELQKDNLKKFVPEANQIIYHKPLSKAETDQIAKSFDEINFKPGEVWVGKKDGLPHKLTLTIVPTSKDILNSDLLISLSAKDFDKPVKIEAPEKTKSFEEISNGLLGGGLDSGGGSATTNSRDSKRRSDLNQYRTALANYAADHGGSYPNTKSATAMSAKSVPFSALKGIYLVTFSDDSKAPSRHYYYASDGKRYGICADLEGQPGKHVETGPNTGSRTVAGPASKCNLLN